MTILGYTTTAERTKINRLLQRIIESGTVFRDIDTVLVDYDYISMSGPGVTPNMPVCSCRMSKHVLNLNTLDSKEVLPYVELL